MNIVKEFTTLMESLDFGTYGTDLYIGVVPQDGPNACWWVIGAGGNPLNKNQTSELTKEYLINVYYRDTDPEQVYESIHNFEIEMNKQTCRDIMGYDTIEIEALAFPTDQDIDNQERTVGLVQVKLKTYYKE